MFHLSPQETKTKLISVELRGCPWMSVEVRGIFFIKEVFRSEEVFRSPWWKPEKVLGILEEVLVSFEEVRGSLWDNIFLVTKQISTIQIK